MPELRGKAGWIAIVLAGTGCVAPGGEGVVEDSGVATPPLDAPVSAATWAPADAAAAWDAALALGWPEGQHAVDVYVELMTHGDEVCPGDPLQLSDDVVLGCTAGSGYRYSGVSEYLEGTLQQEGVTTQYRALHGDLRIETPEGAAYWVGGTVGRLWAASEGPTVTERIEGTWIWEDDPGPFRGGVSGKMEVAATPGVVDTLTLVGGLSFGGVAFEADLSVGHDGCAAGSLALRDPTRGWHAASFDGCDGCAVVTHTDGAVGEACFDLSPLAALPSAWLADSPSDSP